MASERKPPFEAANAYRDGYVTLRGAAKSRSDYGAVSIDAKVSIDLTTAEARALAASLIAQADAADLKVAKKVAAEARRKAWRDREVAAGRMKVMSMKEFFR